MPKVTQIFFSIFLKLVFLYVFLCLWYTFCPISVFIFVEITKDFTQFSLISEASRCSWTIGHLPNSTQNLKTLPIGPWSWLMPKKGTCRQGTLDDFIFTSKYDLRSSIFSFDWKLQFDINPDILFKPTCVFGSLSLERAHQQRLMVRD